MVFLLNLFDAPPYKIDEIRTHDRIIKNSHHKKVFLGFLRSVKNTHSFMITCNFTRRLKVLKLRSEEYVCKIWINEPKCFDVTLILVYRKGTTHLVQSRKLFAF